MGVLVEMSEEECARRWLAKNGLVAVSWPVITKLVESQLHEPFVVFNPAIPTYELKEAIQ